MSDFSEFYDVSVASNHLIRLFFFVNCQYCWRAAVCLLFFFELTKVAIKLTELPLVYQVLMTHSQTLEKRATVVEYDSVVLTHKGKTKRKRSQFLLKLG